MECVCEALRGALAACPSTADLSTDAVLEALRPALPALVSFARRRMEGEDCSRESCLRLLLPHVAAALVSLESRCQPSPSVLLPDEEASRLEAAQRGWFESLADELRAIAEEQGRPVVMPRQTEASTHLGFRTNDDPVLDARFLYDSDDLFDAVSSLVLGNETSNANGFRRLLPLPSIAELSSVFAELGAEHRQLGVDDDSNEGSGLCETRLEMGQRVLSLGTPSDARKFLRHGSPPSVRPKLWRQALGLCPQQCSHDVARNLELTQEWQRWDLVCDEMVVADVRLTTEDPNYFVFEVPELCFSR